MRVSSTLQSGLARDHQGNSPSVLAFARWYRSVCPNRCLSVKAPHRVRPRPSANSATAGTLWQQPARESERRDTGAADSIPIACHRLRGRFSPTGSFAYRTRGDATALVNLRAPRPPGKRLSALCTSLHKGRNCLERTAAARMLISNVKSLAPSFRSAQNLVGLHSAGGLLSAICQWPRARQKAP
jgi:hypothetical protein